MKKETPQDIMWRVTCGLYDQGFIGHRRFDWYRRYRARQVTDVSKSILETSKGMHKCGVITKAKLKEFKNLCKKQTNIQILKEAMEELISEGILQIGHIGLCDVYGNVKMTWRALSDSLAVFINQKAEEWYKNEEITDYIMDQYDYMCWVGK